MWIYRDTAELCHHGILGMKWGKRNGPPYPLSESSKSMREKRAARKQKRNEEAIREKIAYAEEKLNWRYFQRKHTWFDAHPIASFIPTAIAEKKLSNSLSKYGKAYNIVYDDEQDRYWVMPKQ